MTPEKKKWKNSLSMWIKNVGILLERHTVRDRLCEARLILIGDLTDRVEVVEDFIEQEKTYRKAVIFLLVSLGGLVTWGLNLIPKAISLVTGGGS